MPPVGSIPGAAYLGGALLGLNAYCSSQVLMYSIQYPVHSAPHIGVHTRRLQYFLRYGPSRRDAQGAPMGRGLLPWGFSARRYAIAGPSGD